MNKKTKRKGKMKFIIIILLIMIIAIPFNFVKINYFLMYNGWYGLANLKDDISFKGYDGSGYLSDESVSKLIGDIGSEETMGLSDPTLYMDNTFVKVKNDGKLSNGDYAELDIVVKNDDGTIKRHKIKKIKVTGLKEPKKIMTTSKFLGNFNLKGFDTNFIINFHDPNVSYRQSFIIANNEKIMMRILDKNNKLVKKVKNGDEIKVKLDKHLILRYTGIKISDSGIKKVKVKNLNNSEKEIKIENEHLDSEKISNIIKESVSEDILIDNKKVNENEINIKRMCILQSNLSTLLSDYNKVYLDNYFPTLLIIEVKGKYYVVQGDGIVFEHLKNNKISKENTFNLQLDSAEWKIVQKKSNNFDKYLKNNFTDKRYNVVINKEYSQINEFI